ncbi:hypothetical protein DBR06_SOUSAS8210110, partial [Sousa chinensis]
QLLFILSLLLQNRPGMFWLWMAVTGSELTCLISRGISRYD